MSVTFIAGGGSTYYVTIPQAMVRQLGWKKGEKKVVRVEKDRVIIEDWRP
ncbi:MAG: AbrB/MazE/SpoVT family DNA-binding domain-containing protein [Candidatus Omnitrophota bacterium]